LLLDIDHFKAFNDRYGHPAGHHCLARVAAAVEGAMRRPEDTVARYGGEEFVVILPHTDVAGAAEVAERVRRAVRMLNIRHAGSPLGIVTASIGVASMNILHEAAATDELVDCADTALYAAKRAGRDQISMAGHRSLGFLEHNDEGDHPALETL
jgi:diguanylate cyclase (GGDEF)-like protein